MEDPRVSFPSSCTSGQAFSHRITYGDVRELGKGGSAQVPGGNGGGEVSACSPAQSYAVAARVVASCAVDLQTFPLASRTSFAIPRTSSSIPAEVSFFRRLPLIGRLLGPARGRVSSPEVAAGPGSAASLPASPLCCPELSSLLPNSHVCRWRNQVCVTAWRDSTVYCYVLPVPSSCFLEEGGETRQPRRASASFYYVHEQPVGLARLLPEHGLLLVAGNLDECSLNSASGDVFLLQYDTAYLHSSSEPSSVHRSKDNALSSSRPSIASPFQAFKVCPLRPLSEVDSASTAEQVPLRIKRRFRIAAPIHGLSLAVSSHAGLLLFSASVRKKKASLLFLSGEAIEDLKAACDEAEASKESVTRDAAAASEAEAPAVCPESEDRKETGGAAAVEAAPGWSFPTENVPFSFCTSEHLPTLPSAPTAYALDRRAQRFFVGGFDAEEGRVWVAVTNFCRLRPELDEEDYNDPQKLRLQRAFLEEQPQSVAEDEELEPNTELDRPFVLLLPLLSCLRYAAKVAASLKRKSLQSDAEKLAEASLREQKPEASFGLRHAHESPPEPAEGETTVLSFLDEPWGAQFYRPVAIAELRSLLTLDVEETFSSRQEAASAERLPDEEVETFLLSHDPASARGYSCSQPLSSFPKADSDSRTLPRRSAKGRLRPSPKLEQDEAVDVVHIAVSRSGRRLAVTLSTCEVLILVRNEGKSPVGSAHVGDATAGRTEKPAELPRQTPPQNSQRPAPLGNPEDKATSAPPRPSATSEETYSASTVQPDHASDPATAPYLPWLYLPAPLVASLRVSMSLGRREVRNGSEPLAKPTVLQAVSSPSETCVKDRFSLVSSLQRYPEYEGLSGLLGCAFSSAAAPGRSEEDAEDVLLLVLGVRASRERLQGLAGFAQKAGASAAPSGNAETVLTTSQAKTTSVLNVDQYRGGGKGGLSPASGGDKAGPAVNLSGAAQSEEPASGDGGVGLLCDELRPTPSMAVDVCALSLKGVHDFLEREGGAVPWEKPVLTVLPNAAPQVTGNVQRWLCPCSAASEALGVGLLPPSWGEEGDEHELGAGKQTCTEGMAKDDEVAPNTLTLVVTLENQGDEEKERGSLETGDWCPRRGRSTLRIWAVEAQSVERLAMELRRRSRFAEAERVCINALENLAREPCVFSAPEEGKTESASKERERERATSFQWYRNLLEDIREERWTQRGRHPDAAEEDFKPWDLAFFPPLALSSVAAPSMPRVSSAPEGSASSFLLVESDPRRFLSWALRRLFVVLKRTELIRTVALPLLHAVLSLAVKQRLPQSLKKANRRSRKQALERAAASMRALALSEARWPEGQEEVGRCTQQKRTPVTPTAETLGAKPDVKKQENADSEENEKTLEDARASALAAAVLAVGASSKDTSPLTSEAPSWSRSQPPRATNREPVSPRQGSAEPSQARAGAAVGDAPEEDSTSQNHADGDKDLPGPRRSRASTSLSESLGSEPKAKEGEKEMNKVSPYSVLGSRPDGFASSQTLKSPGPPSPLLLSVAGDQLRALYALHVALTQFLFYEEEVQRRRSAQTRARMQRGDDGDMSDLWEAPPHQMAASELFYLKRNWEERTHGVVAPPATTLLPREKQNIDFFTFIQLPLQTRLALLTGVTQWRRDSASGDGEVEGGASREPEGRLEDRERAEAVRVVEKLRRRVVQPQLMFDDIFFGMNAREWKTGEGKAARDAVSPAFGFQLHLTCAFGGGRGRNVQRPELAGPLPRIASASPFSRSTLSSPADFCACLNAFCASPVPQQIADFCLEVLPWSSASLTRSAPDNSSAASSLGDRSLATRSLRLSGDRGVDASRLGCLSLAVVAEVVRASSPLVSPSVRLLRRRSDVGEIALCAVYHRSSLLPASSLLPLVDRLYNALPQSFEEEDAVEPVFPAGKEERGEKTHGGDTGCTERSRGQLERAERAWVLERRKRLRVLTGGADMLEQHLDAIEFLNRHLSPSPPRVTFQQLKAACLSPSSARLMCASLLRALCRTPRATSAGTTPETESYVYSSCEGVAICSQPITCNELLDRAVYIHRRACAALPPEELYEILLTTCATEVSFVSSAPSSPSAGGFASVLQHLRPLARASGSSLARAPRVASTFSAKRLLVEALLERWRDVALLAGDARLEAFFPRAAACLLACARDLVNAAPSLTDPSLAAARELLRICLGLDRERRRVQSQRRAERNPCRGEAAGPGLQSEEVEAFSQDTQLQRGTKTPLATYAGRPLLSPEHKEDVTCLAVDRQGQVLARQIRSELRFLAFVKTLSALLASKRVSGDAAPGDGLRRALASTVSAEGTKVLGVEFVALASVAGSSAKAAKAAMVGAARGGGALARGALEASGSAASSTMRLLRSYGSLSAANRLIDGEVTQLGAAEAESSRRLDSAASCSARSSDALGKQLSPQETEPISHSWGPLSSSASASVSVTSPASGLASLSGWLSTPLQVRLAAAEPGGLARVVQAILRACPEAADETQLLEKLATLLEREGEEGNWRGRWRLYEARAWAYWVRGRAGEALSVLATLLVLQQRSPEGETETRRRAAERRSNDKQRNAVEGEHGPDSGHSNEVRVRPLTEGEERERVIAVDSVESGTELCTSQKTLQRTTRRSEGRKRPSRCLLYLIAENDPSLSILTLQFAQKRSLPFVFETGEGPSSFSSSFSSSVDAKKAPLQADCLSPNVRGALLALAVRRCDALHLPLLLGAFAAVQHEHCMLQAAALLPRKACEGVSRGKGNSFDEGDTEGGAADAQSFLGDPRYGEAFPTYPVQPEGEGGLQKRPTGTSLPEPPFLERESGASSGWIPATSADWFSSGASALPSCSPWPFSSLKEGKAGGNREEESVSKLLALPGGASTFWTRGGAGRLEQVRDREAEKSPCRSAGGKAGAGTSDVLVREDMTAPSVFPKILTTSLFLRARQALGLSASSRDAPPADSTSASEGSADASSSSSLSSPPSSVFSSSLRTIRPPPVAPAALVFSAIGVAEGMVNFAALRARQEYDKRLGSLSGSSSFLGDGREGRAAEPEATGGAEDTAGSEVSPFSSRASTGDVGRMRDASDPRTTPERPSLPRGDLAGPLADALHAVRPRCSSSIGEKERRQHGEGTSAGEAPPADANVAGTLPAGGQVQRHEGPIARAEKNAPFREAEHEGESGRKEEQERTSSRLGFSRFLPYGAKEGDDKKAETVARRIEGHGDSEVSPEAILIAEAHVLESVAELSAVGPSILPSLRFWPQAVAVRPPLSMPFASNQQPPASGLERQSLLSFSPASGWDLPLLLFGFFLLQTDTDSGEERETTERFKGKQPSRRVGGELEPYVIKGERRFRLSLAERHVAGVQPFLHALLQTDVEAAFLVAALLSLNSPASCSPSPCSASGGAAVFSSSRSLGPWKKVGATRSSLQGAATFGPFALPQCAFALLRSYLSASGDAVERSGERNSVSSELSPVSPSVSALNAAFCPPARAWNGAACAARADVSTEVLLQLLLRWVLLFFASHSSGDCLASVASLSRISHPVREQGRGETAHAVFVSAAALVHSLFLVRDFFHVSDAVLLLLGLLPKKKEETDGDIGQRRARAVAFGGDVLREASTLNTADAPLLPLLARDAAFRRQLLLQVTQAFPEKLDFATALLPVASALQWPLNGLETRPLEGRGVAFSLLSLSGDRVRETESQKHGRVQEVPAEARRREARTQETEVIGAEAKREHRNQTRERRAGGEFDERGVGFETLQTSKKDARRCEELLTSSSESGPFSASHPQSSSSLEPSPNPCESFSEIVLQAASSEPDSTTPPTALSAPRLACREVVETEAQGACMQLSPLESREQSWGHEQEGLDAFRMRLETFDGLFLSPLQPLSSFVVKLLEQLPLLFFVPSENRGRGRGGGPPRPEEEGGGGAEEREDERGEQGGVWETGRWILRLLRIYTKALAFCRFYEKSTDGLVVGKAVKTLLDVGGDEARGEVESGDKSRGAENRDEERRALHLGAQLQAAGVFVTEKERPVSSVSGTSSPCGALQGILEKTVFLRRLFSRAACAAGCSSRAFLAEVLCNDRQPPRRCRDINGKEEGTKQLGNGGEREGGSETWPLQERVRNSRETAQRENVARIIRDTGLGCTQVDDAMSALLSLLPLVDITSIFLPRSLAAQKEGCETERAGEEEEEREAGRGKEAPAKSEEESGQDPFLHAVLEALGGSNSWKKSQSLPGEGESIALLAFFQKGPSVLSRRSPSSFVAEALLLRDLERRLEECSSMSLVSLSSVGPGSQEDDGANEEGEAGNYLEEGNKARKAVQSVPANDVDAEDFVSLLLPFIPLSRWEATVANLSVRVGLHWGETQKSREAGCPFVRQAVLLYLIQRMRRALEKRMQAGEVLKGEHRGVAEDEEVEGGEGKASRLMSRNVDPVHLLQKLRFQEAWLLLSTAWDHALARSSSFSVSCFPPRMSPQGSPSFDPHTQKPPSPPSPSSSPSSSPFSPCSPLVSSPPGELRQQQESLASACVNVLLYCEESKFPAFASSFWFALCSCPASLFPEWKSWLEVADQAGERIQEPKARSAFVAAGLRSLRTRAANLLSGLSVSEGDVDETCENMVESERGRKVLSFVADAEAGSAVGAFVAAGLLPWLQNLHARLCGESSGREARRRETASQSCSVSDAATVLFAHTGHHFQLLLRRLAGVPGSDALRKSLFTALAKAVCSWIMALYAECGAEDPAISSFSSTLRTPRRENDAQTLLFSLVLSDSLLQHCDASSRGTWAAPRASADAVDPSPFLHLKAILLWLTAQCMRVLTPLGPQVEETLGDSSRGERESTWLLALAPSSPLSLSALSSLFAKHTRQSQRLRGESGGEAGEETEKSEEEQLGVTERSVGFEFCRAFIEARSSFSQSRLRRSDSDRENVCGENPVSSATRAATDDPLGKPLLLCERRSKQQRLRDRLCGVVLLRAVEDEENRHVQRGGATDQEPSVVCLSATANRLWVPPAAFAPDEDAETAKDQIRGRREKRDGEDEKKRTPQPQPASPRSSVSLWRSLLAGAESEEEALLIALMAPPNWSLMVREGCVEHPVQKKGRKHAREKEANTKGREKDRREETGRGERRTHETEKEGSTRGTRCVLQEDKICGKCEFASDFDLLPRSFFLQDAGDGQEREFPSVSWFSSSPALNLLTVSTEGKTAFSLASMASGSERPQEAVRRALAWLQGWEAAPLFQGPQLTRLTSRLEKGHALLLVALTALSGASFGSASLDYAVVATLANGDWLEPFETDAREADARRESLQSALPGLVIFGDSKTGEATDSQTLRAGKSRPSEDSWQLQDPSEDAATRHVSFRSSRPLPAFAVSSESFKSWPAVRAQVAVAVCAWYRQLAPENGQEGDGEEECRDEREECLLAVLAHVLQWLVLLRPHLLSRHLREARVERRETARVLHAREAERNGEGQETGEARQEDRARWRLAALQNAVDQYRLSLAAAPSPRSRAGVLVRRPWSRPVPEGSEEGEAHFSVFWDVEREDIEAGCHLGEGQLACPARPGWRCRFPATAWLLYRAALEAHEEEEGKGRERERQRIRENAEAITLTEGLGTRVPSVSSSLAALPRLPFASTCEAGALCGSFLLFATGACPAFLAGVARQREEVDGMARASYLERSREMRRASALRESGDSLWRHVTGRLGEAVQKVSWLL
ncbi:hypothetical protein TGRUB_236930 [Toxoplasma gondii RUB]|uniref:Uncharacterized protein n=1 Tax=Toxoplasma gondii RUB TaxID=935652 RepID=A0A086M0H3_TOXGO|nr:hypothetical protein TGRUB_236930 [Toxoplasma gondii RUB]